LPTTTERVVLIHAAVGDSRMWDRQAQLLRARGCDVVTPDLRGFGAAPLPDGGFSNVDDVAQFLPAALVGNSLGGRVALETALAHPADVDTLVLVSPALADHDWSDEIKDYWRREEELFESGDIDAATQLTLDVFALPHVHDTLEPMVRRAYELQSGPEPEVSWPERRPLGSLRPRTLVLVGEHDLTDFHAIAERIVREAPDARLEVVPGAKHVPSLEQPEAFEALVVAFLDG
jgi:pimeloyl-ACP methyl ester carboxylesterase